MGPAPLPPLVALVVCVWCLGSSHVDGREVVCTNVDIRNTVDNFRKLDNCTVIEGYVQILLIDNGQPHDYDGLSFPRLVEITGYLLLYRAFGLHSLGRLFPNLAVIRGNILFHNYAFVVFEMYQLQEISLSRLTDVLRGSVRLEKNPSLCYVDTVDWDRIAPEGKGGHFIKANKKWEECPNTCPADCPAGPKTLCWNSHHCQKVCPVVCESHNTTCALDGSGRCCHLECLGGCSGTTSADCVACRHVAYKGRCMRKCPPGTFEFMGRRCVQDGECRNLTHDTGIGPSKSIKIDWKPFAGQCIQDCPAGYVADKDDPHLCVQCVGKCPKVCIGTVIDNVAAAQNFHGCTHINGSLEVHIQGGTNVIKELEENLNAIEEIQGYLKIARSFPLISLNFLKSLRTIHGESLDKKNYSLLVLDNQNLQELWDWKHRKVKLDIKRGKIFFHFNSKLCPAKIGELKKYARTQDWDENDVSLHSNGDRVPCEVANMNVVTKTNYSTMVEIEWDRFRSHDERLLLGYVIYYRETLYKNLTIFEGRDACGSDLWTMRDVEIVEDDNDTSPRITYMLTDLKPFTMYALYIRTYSIESEKRGAQSNIAYVETLPDRPTPPVNIRARPTVHGEVAVTWQAPKFPNGLLTHYVVEGVHEVDPTDFINQRNYCLEPLTIPDYRKLDEEEEIVVVSGQPWSPGGGDNTSTAEEECCACTQERRRLGGVDEDDAEFQIHFEDFLHNNVYFKNPGLSRRRRRRREVETSPCLGKDATAEDVCVNGSMLEFHRRVFANKSYYLISNLRHFTEYTIEIRACQERNPDLKTRPCSSRAITSVRTLHLGGADDIRSGSVQVQTENVTSYSGHVRWEEPSDPNGAVLAYHIEYRRLNGENHKPILMCITRKSYLQRGGFFLSELPPGNYSLRLRATSLAGIGNWTSYVYFTVVAASETYTLEIVLGVAVMLVILLTFIGIYGVYKWKLSPRVPDNVNYASVNPEYISAGLVYEPDEWELPREKIKLLEELGQGSFGMVYRGEVYDLDDSKPLIPCAAKTVNETATLRERIEFLQEASVMKAFNCHHVIKLLGVVSKGQPTLVVMELMANGDLKTYLRSHRPDSEEQPGGPPTLRQVLQMAAEIADGMAYLSAKKFVHRDLAARNCMVADDLTVKIGDFGMTRDIYETDYYRKGGKGLLPVRWMAPESLKDGIFDKQTDVWSYGVVLWEMVTLASQPYQGLSNEDVLKYVISGKTMSEPENCPSKMYSLMAMCWHRNPKARPTFQEIVEMLLPDVHPRFRQIAYYYTQRHLMNPADSEEDPATPLHCPAAAPEEPQELRFFPSATQPPEPEPEYVVEVGGEVGKIGSVSNGSVANGHIRSPTQC